MQESLLFPSAFPLSVIPGNPHCSGDFHVSPQDGVPSPFFHPIIQAKRIIFGSFSDPAGHFSFSAFWYIYTKRKYSLPASAGFFSGEAVP
jgi:hypothetical protein